MRRIYLDNNATTPIADEVKWEMQRALWLFGNANSMHADGREAKAAVERARERVAKLINAEPTEIIFTSGGSETNNTVFNTMLELARHSGLDPESSNKKSLFDWTLDRARGDRTEIIVSSIEHPSILEMTKFLQTLGFTIHYLSVDENGFVEMKKLEQVLSDRTLLVSVMLANNETGAIQNIKKITRLAKRAGALVHTDAVQAVGKIPVDVNDLGVDYLTISAHKIHGPKGVGALYTRIGSPLVPLIFGGHQERELRAGTTNNLGIIGFGEAVRHSGFIPESMRLIRFRNKSGMTVANLRDKLRKEIIKAIPHIIINTPAKNALPNTLNVSFLGAEGESIMLALDHAGIEVSTGSACVSGSIEPSHVLMAQHHDAEIAHGSIRFSLSEDTTDADIDYVIKTLPPIVEKLRKISTIGEQYE